MRFLCFLILPLVRTCFVNADEVVVLEYFYNVHNEGFSAAKSTCDLRGGVLAGQEVSFDDWDIYALASSTDEVIVQDTYFTISVTRDAAKVWRYSNDIAVDMSSSIALVLRENDNYIDGEPQYNCVLWNPWEPFYIPSICDDYNAFICRLPVTIERACEMDGFPGQYFTDIWNGIIETLYGLSESNCLEKCTRKANLTLEEFPCWAAEHYASISRCQLLKSKERPAVIPPMASMAGRSTFLKTCKTVASFPENTCTILCKCDTMRTAIVIPETEEEMRAFVEEVKQQTKKELEVPTKNLSATVRKKKSAKDERGSSTGMGALGITLICLVFGGLIALDITSLFAAMNANVTRFKPLTRKEPSGI